MHEGSEQEADARAARPRLHVQGAWQNLFREPAREGLEEALPRIVRGRRWFGGKARAIASARSRRQRAPGCGRGLGASWHWFASSRTAATETYAVPLAFAEGHRAEEIENHHPESVLAELEVETRQGAREGLLVEALESDEFCQGLLERSSGDAVCAGKRAS